MGHLMTVALGLAGSAAFSIAIALSVDAIPALARGIVVYAACRMWLTARAANEEDWLGCLEDFETKVGKLKWALGCLAGSFRQEHPFAFRLRTRRRRLAWERFHQQADVLRQNLQRVEASKTIPTRLWEFKTINAVVAIGRSADAYFEAMVELLSKDLGPMTPKVAEAVVAKIFEGLRSDLAMAILVEQVRDESDLLEGQSTWLRSRFDRAE